VIHDPPVGEPARTRRLSILEGGFATVHIAITTGPLVTAYALYLGANGFRLGLLAAATALSAVGSMLGAHAVGLLGARRRLTVVTAVAGRSLWGVLCLLPFVGLGADVRFAVFLVAIVAGNALINAGGAAWLSWMSDLVPLPLRGRYFGARNAILGAVGMAVTYGAGRAFDAFRSVGRTGTGLAWIFGMGVAFAWFSGFVLARQWDPPLTGERPRRIAETLAQPMADRSFRRLLEFLVLWSAATGVAAPFFAAHLITNLHVSLSRMALFSIVSGTLNLAMLPFWGLVIDRFGNRPVLSLNMIGIAFLPLLWLFATPRDLAPIWIDAVLTGIFWPGFTLANFNLILATAPEKDRTAYLGAQNVAVGASAFVASIAGGVIASALAALHHVAGWQTFVNFHVLFAVSAAARLALVPVALRLREEKAGSVAAVLDFVGDEISARFMRGFQAGVAVVRAIGTRDDGRRGG
jgi:hypothetical protein